MEPDERWVLALEHGPDGDSGPAGLRVPVGSTLVVGREGDLPLGVEVADPGISRRALDVTAVAEGWQVEVRNTNRAVLHAWGQTPVPLTGDRHLAWPRIAIRVLNGESVSAQSARVHWVLFEADAIPVTRVGPDPHNNSGSSTYAPERPAELTDKQDEAIRMVFAEHLAWPPRLDPQPLKLDTAGRRLGVGAEAVQRRLAGGLAKAQQLGWHRSRVVDPGWTHLLVREGYLAPPRHRMHRHVLAWRG